MSNKDKQTMDYWRHSTGLFEETEMELATANMGFEAYGLYCFLMEKINYNINDGLIIDDDKICLFARKTYLSIKKCREIINELVKRDLFDKYKYFNNSILTNYSSDSGKELVKTTRQNKRDYINKKRKETNVDSNNANVFCKDIDINKDIEKDKIQEDNIKSVEANPIDEEKEFLRLKEEFKKRRAMKNY